MVSHRFSETLVIELDFDNDRYLLRQLVGRGERDYDSVVLETRAQVEMMKLWYVREAQRKRKTIDFVRTNRYDSLE